MMGGRSSRWTSRRASTMCARACARWRPIAARWTTASTSSWSSRCALREADTRRSTSEAMLAAAEEGHRVRTKLFAIGLATTLEVAEAETQLERARLGVVDARIERRIGEARLAYALGRPL